MNTTIENTGELGLKYDRINIQVRRSKVLSLLSQGLNGSEIARELGVSANTISLDRQYLEETAHDKIKDFITKDLPLQVKIARDTYTQLKRKAFELTNNAETNNDIKLAFQGLALIKDITESQINLDTNQNVIDNVITKIEFKVNKISNDNELVLESNTSSEDNRKYSYEDEGISESEAEKEGERIDHNE